jgi:hypothetical protein
MHGSRSGYRRPWALHPRWELDGAVIVSAICLVLLGLCPVQQALATEQNILDVPPTVSFQAGQVEQSHDGGVTWAVPSPEFSMPSRALLRTGGDGSCVLMFLDHTVGAVKPGSTVQVIPPAQELRLVVLSGKAWVRFDDAVENSRNGIALPQVTVLALGACSLSVEVGQSASVVKVLEGSVQAVFASGQARATINAGQTLTAGPDGLLPATAFDIALETAEWQPLLEQGGVSATTTTLLGTTTTRPLPPDGPVGIPLAPLAVLGALGAAAVAVLAILGTFIYLIVNRAKRRRKAGL